MTIQIEGCFQTEQCSFVNGLCVGQDEALPEWMTEDHGKCEFGCKCISPGQEPVTFTVHGQEPVTLPPITTKPQTPPTTTTTAGAITTTTITWTTSVILNNLISQTIGQEPVTLNTTGQEPVTIVTQGCSQTGQCGFINGVCVGRDEDVPEWMTEITGICDLGCKCIAAGEEPVTLTTPGQQPVTLTPPGEEPVTFTTPGQDPVTLTTKGCAQTEICGSSNGLCVGELETVPDWLTESFDKCFEGCKCISPGQQPVTFTSPSQDPVTLASAVQESHEMTTHSTSDTSRKTTSMTTWWH